MCGRFVSPTMAEAERNFTIDLLQTPWDASFNLAPSESAPVLYRHNGQNVCAPMRFGMIPFFAHGVAPKYSTINATVENLQSSASWRGPWTRAQRALVLSNGFYEWQVLADGRSKQPYFIHPADQQTFAFAGLWDVSKSEDGTRIYSFAIVTLPASPLMAQIHNAKQREPAILARQDLAAWLSGSSEEAKCVLRPYPDDLLSAHPVSARVNSTKNDDATLTQSAPTTATLF